MADDLPRQIEVSRDRITKLLTNASNPGLFDVGIAALRAKGTQKPFGQVLGGMQKDELERGMAMHQLLTGERKAAMEEKQFERQTRMDDLQATKLALEIKQAGAKDPVYKRLDSLLDSYAKDSDDPVTARARIVKAIKEDPEELSHENMQAVVARSVERSGVRSKPTEKPQSESEFVKNLRAAGFEPGSKEWITALADYRRKQTHIRESTDGVDVQFNEDGTVAGIRTGSAASLPALTVASRTKLQGKRIDTVDQLSRLADINKLYDPKHLTFDNRWTSMVSDIRERVGGPEALSEKERKELSDFASFRQASIRNLNKSLNELSGAAITAQEFERLKQDMPNPGIGLFDGDGPTQFKAKLDSATRLSRNAILRYNWALNNNRNPLDSGIGLADVDDLVERRFGELMREATAKIADPVTAKAEATARLKQEFGMP